MNNRWWILLSFLIFIIIISTIPYRQEAFEMDVDLNKMSCKEFLEKLPNGSQVLNGIMGHHDREHVLADMDRAVIPIYTPDGVIYNDTDYCILRRDKLKNYRMNDKCRLDNYQLLPTDKYNFQPDGCIINPQDWWFTNFIDKAFYSKNKERVDTINQLKNEKQKIQQEKDAVSGQLRDMTGKFINSEANHASCNAKNSSLQAQFDASSLQYQALMKKLQTMYGRNADQPAKSAMVIRQSTGTAENGIYYIDCGGVSKPVYCVMDPNFDGGAWMMIMKMSAGNTFHFYSSYWTSANTLNEQSLDMSEADAKYDVFNKVGIKDVMAIYPRNHVGVTGGSIPNNIGWCWLVNNWYRGGERITALAGFDIARDANPSDPYSFSGWNSRIWGSQEPSRRHVFGGHGHLATGWSGHKNDWGTVRWGFVFNENGHNDFKSNDVWGGIGGGNRYGGNVHNWGGSQYFSAGDYFGCCGRPGINRRVAAFLFGR